MKQKNQKQKTKFPALRTLAIATILAGLLNPGTPWRD